MLTDEELMLATARGDLGAFGQIVERHQAPQQPMDVILRYHENLGHRKNAAALNTTVSTAVAPFPRTAW